MRETIFLMLSSPIKPKVQSLLGLHHTTGEIYSVMQQGIFDNDNLKNYITYFDLLKLKQRFYPATVEGGNCNG